jgi:hypothetical protein
MVGLGATVRRRLAVDRMLPRGTSLSGLAGSLLVPGLGFQLRSRVWGRPALAVCVALVIIFVVWLGYPIANIAFGLLLSIHVSAITYYCSDQLNSTTLGRRMLVALLLTVCLSMLMYFPLRNAMQERYFAPLRIENRVVVFQKSIPAGTVQRGDLVAYNLTGVSGDNVYAHGGLTSGTVLGMPGDQITFTTNSFTINGVARPRLNRMPAGGAVVVPENQWFIWPNMATIGGHGNVSEATISGIMLQMALVPQQQFAGKPFKKWFGRRQEL